MIIKAIIFTNYKKNEKILSIEGFSYKLYLFILTFIILENSSLFRGETHEKIQIHSLVKHFIANNISNSLSNNFF